MARADFYLIAKPRFREEPLRLVCELVRKSYAAELWTLILARDAEQAEALDDMLWDMGEDAYIPHQIAGMDEEDLAVLMHGMKQLADGAGAAPDRPLTGIGIRGFNDMRYTLHLEFAGQDIVGETDTEFLDLMRCRHVVTDEVIELYNLVPRPVLRHDGPGAPRQAADD